jgi:tetratricopeptide (TPR) repeat protein
VNEVRQEWYDECESILDQLEAEGGRDVETASLRALLLRDRGDIDGGQQVLLELAGSGGPQAINAALALARYQNEVGRSAAAEQTLRQARTIQDPLAREADAAVGDFLFDQQRYDEALQAYEQAAGGSDNPSLELRLIECHVRLGRLDEAREMLDARAKEGQDGFMEQMMAAAIADGRAALLLRDGRNQDAKLEQSRRDEALRRAEAIMPSSAQPYVQRALALVRDYERAMLTTAPDDDAAQRRNLTLLDEAFRALEQADDVQFGDASTSLTRVTVLQAMNDIPGAIGELLRLLERDPDQDRARLALAALQYARGDEQAAIRTLEQGIARTPSRQEWYVALGEIHRKEALRLQQEPDPRPVDAAARATDAARAFMRAAELGPSAIAVARIVNLYMGTIPPQLQQAANVLDAYPQQVEASGLLRGMHARVLDGLGQREPAIEELRQSYRLSRAAAEHDEMMNWYRTLQALFRERPAAEVEAFVMDVAGQQPQLMDVRWLARRWAGAGADGLSRAVELQEQAVRMSDNADAAVRAVMLYELGGYLVMDEQYDPAARAFARAIDIQPSYKQALNNYAYLLAIKLSRPQEALAPARRAVALLNRQDPLPEQATLLDTLGWVTYLSGDRAGAETHLRRSLERMEMASNHYHLAVLLAAEDRLDAASTHLQRAAELRPDPETRAEINALADDIRTRKGRG